MTAAIFDYLSALCLAAGGLFSLVGALGVLRFPDVYTRTHAASKAGTLGSGFCLLAVALQADSAGIVSRAFIAIVFFMLTAPIAAHLLARAAFKAGYPSVSLSNAYKNETPVSKQNGKTEKP